MSKLFNLKEWLTLADAARHLTIVFDEEVSEADVLRLALDGRLRLSVYLVNKKLALCGRRVSISEATYKEVPSPDGASTVRLYEGPVLYSGGEGEEGQVVELGRELVALLGVYDLPLIGGEWRDIEQQYHDLIGGTFVDHIFLDGAFVEGRDGLICQLQEEYEHSDCGDEELLTFMREINDDKKTLSAMESLVERDKERRRSLPRKRSYFPAGGLPEDAVIVVRTQELRELEESLNAAPVSTSRIHVSDKLAKMNQAAARFWENADRNERGTHPENAKVAAWLVQQGFSQTLADKAATIIRPEWAPSGRKPEE